MLRRVGAILLVAAIAGRAQTAAILERLDQLEADNKRMAEEIAQLRSQLAAANSASPKTDDQLEERVAVQESRTAELERKKVESSQKMPVELTGMLLFNAFSNGRYSSSAYSGTSPSDPVTASAAEGNHTAGATFRQTSLGLRFFGPDLPGGGQVSGSVYMDFFSGSLEPSNNIFRLRVATLDLKWKNTTVTVGQDKPIISPREPTSLAQVGVSPLSGAGNLWEWQPQARVEQRFKIGDSSEIKAQGGVFESYESADNVPAPYTSTVGLWRPAYEGRIEYSYTLGGMRFEIAPGYHAGSSRVAGQSVKSRAVSLDWLVRTSSWLEFTGAWYTGQNLSGLGTLRQGFTILPNGEAVPVHIDGGWGQATITATSRWSFHLFGGEENDRARDLAGNAISRNFVYGANTMWKLAPNIIVALEASQARTTYLLSGTRLNNHYDLALAYLF